MIAYKLVPEEKLQAWLSNHTDWAIAEKRLKAVFGFDNPGSVHKASVFSSRIDIMAEGLGHHPIIQKNVSNVIIFTTTHDAGDQITDLDLTLAERISSLYANIGDVSLSDVLVLRNKADKARRRSLKQKIQEKETALGRKILRFDPDYFHCLWDESDGGSVDHHGLSLSKELMGRIDKFIDHWCTTVNWENPLAEPEGLWDDKDWAWHDKEKEEIFASLKNELKNQYEIIGRPIEL